MGDDQKRTENPRGGGINSGLERFAIGLGKKVIIANQMAVYADKAFELLASKELTTAFSWMGAVAYTLQIYYDFSGYSDMAIGLGEIFGFHFPENFNYPYISKSITEFWRRWHISLSSWFKDYVYIPLGGSRCSTRRMFFNLFIVWLCTGVWHGANYTFWLWGIIYFVVLAAEKLMMKSRPEKCKAPSDTAAVSVFKHVYTLLMVIFLWVLFRADSLRDAGLYMLHMLGNGTDTGYAVGVTKLYLKNGIGYFIIAMIGCIPWTAVLKRRINLSERSWNRISQLCVILIFAIACCVTIDSNYNPFIYFNF